MVRELKFLSRLSAAIRDGAGTPAARNAALALLEKESADEKHLFSAADGQDAKDSKDSKDSKESDSLGLLMGEDNSLSFVVHKIKGLYFMSTKKSVFDALLNGQSVSGFYSAPRITINRIKAAKAREVQCACPLTPRLVRVFDESVRAGL